MSHFSKTKKPTKRPNAAQLVAQLVPKNSSPQTWIEIFGFSLIALGLGVIFSPTDPLFIHASFPWLWLVPTLLALRYGSLAALSSSVLLAMAWACFQWMGMTSPEFPYQYFLGGLSLTFIVGSFSDVWMTRLARIRSVNTYLSERLDSLTHRHYLLKISAEQLEQSLLSKPMTLNETLVQLRELITVDQPIYPQENSPIDPLLQASELMRILTQAGRLERAYLYAEIEGRLQTIASAFVGENDQLIYDDPMVKSALSRNEICHIQTTELGAAHSRYLVVAPILTSDKRRLGLLVIERMPFIALNPELLQFIGVALSYYADTITLPVQVRELVQQFHCPYLFAVELSRLERIYRESGIASIVIALRFDQEHQPHDFFNETIKNRRQLDVIWIIQDAIHPVLITLMPLHNQNAAMGYLNRLQHQFQQQFEVNTLTEAGIVPYVRLVGSTSSSDLLDELLTRCHVKYH